MCKLCNSNRPCLSLEYIKINKKIKKPTIDFLYIAYEYIKEYPCSRCIANYGTYIAKHKENPNIDEFILTRLYSNYYVSKKGYKKSYNKLTNLEMSMDVEKKRHKVAQVIQSFKKEYISKNVHKIVKTKTNEVTYLVTISGKKKTFKTLVEAQKYQIYNAYESPNLLNEKYISMQEKKYVVRGKNTKYIGRFKNLKEAISARDNYLKGLENGNNTI